MIYCSNARFTYYKKDETRLMEETGPGRFLPVTGVYFAYFVIIVSSFYHETRGGNLRFLGKSGLKLCKARVNFLDSQLSRR